MALEDTTVLVTGSTDGVGRLVARRLGERGATVLVHGRNQERGERLRDELRASGGGERSAFYRADLSSLADVRALAEAIERDHERLDLLIGNAGIGGGPRGSRRETSADGIELRFAVNYLAGFLLTRLLLPRIVESAPARIVNVSSAGQHPIDFDDPMLTRHYDGMRAYAQSKLAQVMFTFDLARELEGTGVTANCLHPATYMDTTMVRQAGVSPLSSVDEGAEAILHLATGPDMEGRTGLYFDGLRESRASAQAYDARAREQLRALSQRLTGESAPAPRG